MIENYSVYMTNVTEPIIGNLHLEYQINEHNVWVDAVMDGYSQVASQIQLFIIWYFILVLSRFILSYLHRFKKISIEEHHNISDYITMGEVGLSVMLVALLFL